MDDQLWEFSLELDHPTCEIVARHLLSIEKRTGLARTSATTTDDDDLLVFLDLIHLQWDEMEGDIASCRNMDFSIFSSSTDIDEVYRFWRLSRREASSWGVRVSMGEKIERWKSGKVEM